MKFIDSVFQRMLLCMMLLIASVSSCFAANADIDALFTAVDVTSVKSNVVTLLTAGIVLSVVFVGAHYVKKGLAAGFR